MSREARRRLAGNVGGGGCVLDKAEEKVGVWNEGEDGRVGGGVSLCAASEGEVGGEDSGDGTCSSEEELELGVPKRILVCISKR